MIFKVRGLKITWGGDVNREQMQFREEAQRHFNT